MLLQCSYAHNNASLMYQGLPATKKLVTRAAKLNAGKRANSMETQSIKR